MGTIFELGDLLFSSWWAPEGHKHSMERGNTYSEEGVTFTAYRCRDCMMEIEVLGS